jgi:hypothetical protein
MPGLDGALIRASIRKAGAGSRADGGVSPAMTEEPVDVSLRALR